MEKNIFPYSHKKSLYLSKQLYKQQVTGSDEHLPKSGDQQILRVW